MHLNKTETLFILKGSIDYIIFDKKGNIKNLFQLSDKGSKKFVYLRIKPNTFHSMIIKSKYVIFYEITSGPFYKKDTVFAKWYKDKFQKEYYLNLKNSVKKFKKMIKKNCLIIGENSEVSKASHSKVKKYLFIN